MKCTLFRAITSLVAFFITTQAKSQQQQTLGGWYIFSAKINIDSNWSGFIETQVRSNKVADHLFYHEIKGGIGRMINNKTQVLLGVGQYATYTNTGNFKSPVQAHEIRLWEQFTLTNNINRVKLEHRYRIEQRFFSNKSYRNRFRYRINAIIPLNSTIVRNKTLYTSIYDEIFLNNRIPHFERNRIFAGLGYQFSKKFTLQTGWLNQYDYSLSKNTSKNFLQASFLFTLLGDVDTKEKHPSTMD